MNVNQREFVSLFDRNNNEIKFCGMVARSRSEAEWPVCACLCMSALVGQSVTGSAHDDDIIT